MRNIREIRFILCEARNPLNIGACARAIANFGFSSLYLADVYADDVNEVGKSLTAEAGISAVNSSFILDKAVYCHNIEEAAKGCDVLFGTSSLHRQHPERDVITLPELPDLISRQEYSTIGLAFGCEKRGLTKEQLSFCNYIVSIPTDERQPSINLGQAVAIAAYELSKLNGIELLRDREKHPAPPEEIHRLAMEMQSALVAKDGPHWKEQTRLRLIRQALLDARMSAQAVNAVKALLK